MSAIRVMRKRPELLWMLVVLVCAAGCTMEAITSQGISPPSPTSTPSVADITQAVTMADTPTPTLLPTTSPLPSPTLIPAPAPTPTPTLAPLPTVVMDGGGPLLIEGQQAQRLMGDPAGVFYAYTATGLYRTADGGATWEQRSAAPPVEVFVFSPAAPDVLYSGKGYPCYAGGEDEPFFRSTDGGATWAEMEAGLNLKPVVVHPTVPNRLYAIGCDGPHLSTDSGQSWTLQGGDVFLLYDVLHIVPVDDWSTVYLGTASEGGGGAVIKSADGGASWQVVTGATGEDIWWVSALAVDPNDPDRVYFAEPNGVWRSFDAGATWQRSQAGLWDVIYHKDGPADQTYGLYAIAFSPLHDTTMYLGTIRGLYVSGDDGASWYKFTGETWDNDKILDVKAVNDEGGIKLYITTDVGVFVFYPGRG